MKFIIIIIYCFGRIYPLPGSCDPQGKTPIEGTNTHIKQIHNIRILSSNIQASEEDVSGSSPAACSGFLSIEYISLPVYTVQKILGKLDGIR